MVRTEGGYRGDTSVAASARAQVEDADVRVPGFGGAAEAPAAAAVLPASALYAVNPANPSYLVETDPAFANYKQWLGSKP